jgi:hypothetical protein
MGHRGDHRDTDEPSDDPAPVPGPPEPERHHSDHAREPIARADVDLVGIHRQRPMCGEVRQQNRPQGGRSDVTGDERSDQPE